MRGLELDQIPVVGERVRGAVPTLGPLCHVGLDLVERTDIVGEHEHPVLLEVVLAEAVSDEKVNESQRHANLLRWDLRNLSFFRFPVNQKILVYIWVVYRQPIFYFCGFAVS